MLPAPWHSGLLACLEWNGLSPKRQGIYFHIPLPFNCHTGHHAFSGHLQGPRLPLCLTLCCTFPLERLFLPCVIHTHPSIKNQRSTFTGILQTFDVKINHVLSGVNLKLPQVCACVLLPLQEPHSIKERGSASHFLLS